MNHSEEKVCNRCPKIVSFCAYLAQSLSETSAPGENASVAHIIIPGNATALKDRLNIVAENFTVNRSRKCVQGLSYRFGDPDISCSKLLDQVFSQTQSCFGEKLSLFWSRAPV